MPAVLPKNPRGGALIVALTAVMIATGMMLSIMLTSSENARRTDQFLERESAFYAATGGVNMVVSDIWGDYVVVRQTGNPNFRSRLEERFNLSDPSPDNPNSNGVVLYDDGANPEPAGLGWIGRRIGRASITKVRLVRADRNLFGGLQRNTDLRVEVEAVTDAGYRVWSSRAITSNNPDDFKGFDFAVLTNNITCSLCHMRVQNMDKAHNKDTAKFNTFERVKVGTLQLLAMRPSSANTNIEGTLYHRGRIEEEFSGNSLSTSQVQSSTVRSVEYNSGSSTIKQYTETYNGVTYGVPKEESFINAPDDSTTGLPQPRQNLYLDYPTDALEMENSDGELPTEFPAPFKDFYPITGTGDPTVNRSIDADEIVEAKADATGYLTGGIQVNIASGLNTYDNGSGIAASDNSTLPTNGAPININQSHNGHVVLVGTEANPIQLNGKVVIEGDVMIQGYVEGTGEIWATGNIYAPGDVLYKNKKVDTDNDGNPDTEVFGVANDGRSNLLGMVAGGNIVVGDYLSQVTHWNSGKSQFFVHGEPEPGDRLPNSSVPDPSLNGTGGGDDSNNSNFANFVTEELAFFNRDEFAKTLTKVPTTSTNSFEKSTPHITDASKYTLNNPVYDPNYVPRYYSMYPYRQGTDPSMGPANIPLYMSDKSKFLTSKNWWNNNADPHTWSTLRNLDQIPASVQGPVVDASNATYGQQPKVLSIHPEWISPGNMLNLLLTEEKKRYDNATTDERNAGKPRQMDALLYTNNAIFAIERKKTQRYSGTWNEATQQWQGGAWSKVDSTSKGSMIVNGAIIAPDLGVLVTGAAQESSSPGLYKDPIMKGTSLKFQKKPFTVNYDARVRVLLDINNSSQTNWGLKRRGWARSEGPLP